MTHHLKPKEESSELHSLYVVWRRDALFCETKRHRGMSAARAAGPFRAAVHLQDRPVVRRDAAPNIEAASIYTYLYYIEAASHDLHVFGGPTE